MMFMQQVEREGKMLTKAALTMPQVKLVFFHHLFLKIDKVSQISHYHPHIIVAQKSKRVHFCDQIPLMIFVLLVMDKIRKKT